MGIFRHLDPGPTPPDTCPGHKGPTDWRSHCLGRCPAGWWICFVCRTVYDPRTGNAYRRSSKDPLYPGYIGKTPPDPENPPGGSSAPPQEER